MPEITTENEAENRNCPAEIGMCRAEIEAENEAENGAENEMEQKTKQKMEQKTKNNVKCTLSSDFR